MKYLNPKLLPIALLFILLNIVLLSSCAVEMLLPEGMEAFGTAELGVLETTVPENAALFRTILSENPAMITNTAELSNINSALEGITLRRATNGLFQLYIEGSEEPIANVYPERGEFKMIKTRHVYPIPSTILSVNGDGVCLRSDASLTNSTVKTQLSRGTLVVQLGEENGWYQVNVVKNNITYNGWISAKYLLALGLDKKKKSLYHMANKGYLQSHNEKPTPTINRNTALSEALSCINEQNRTKNIFFLDNFFSSYNSWTISSSDKVLTPLNTFTISNTQRGLTFSFPLIQTTVPEDFEVFVTAAHLSGEAAKGYGIIFNYINRDRFCLYSLSANGTYSVTQYIDGVANDLIPWTYSNKIRLGEGNLNSLGMKFCGTHCLFLINDIPVDAISNFLQISGNPGLFVDGTQSIVFNHYSLYSVQSENTW